VKVNDELMKEAEVSQSKVIFIMKERGSRWFLAWPSL
jgi:hypothetical protein